MYLVDTDLLKATTLKTLFVFMSEVISIKPDTDWLGIIAKTQQKFSKEIYVQQTRHYFISIIQFGRLWL